MRLSYCQFAKQCEMVVNALCDWRVVVSSASDSTIKEGSQGQGQGQGVYLASRACRLVSLNVGIAAMHTNCDLSEEYLVEDTQDIGCFGEVSSQVVEDTLNKAEKKESIYVFEFNIVYSTSYGVPVLYFNVYSPEGSLLLLHQVIELLSNTNANFNCSQIDKWTFITQGEHPFLGIPFFYLHPCKTGEFMAQVFESTQGKGKTSEESLHDKYLVSWLSFFGPLVGLFVSTQNFVTI